MANVKLDYDPTGGSERKWARSRQFEYWDPSWKLDEKGNVIKPEPKKTEPVLEKGKIVFNCNSCEFESSIESEMQEHIKTHKKKEEVNECSGDGKKRKRRVSSNN